MQLSRQLTTLWFVLVSGGLIHGQTTVAIPSTGANAIGGQDASWSVITSDIPGETATGQAWIVPTLPGGWLTPEPNSAWIAPAADQTNQTRPGSCCQGRAVYAVSFTVVDPATAVANLKIAADEVVTVYLNGTDDNHIVYSTTGPTYTGAVPVTIKQGALYTDPGGYSHTVQYVAGRNVLTVEVLNYGGGPTGLYVKSDVSSGGSDSGLYPDMPYFTVWDALGIPEPVDGANGQYFDTFTDLVLGGPVGLAFGRYYGSQLSATGYTGMLGTNWMSNFDVALKVSGSNATVLTFGGQVVKFNGSAGNWKLTVPADAAYQLLQSSSGYVLVDPRSTLRYNFSTTGALVSIVDRVGNTIALIPGPSGPAQASWGPYTLSFSYNAKLLTSVRDQSGRELRFSYAGGLLSSFTDITGQTTNYSYTSAGKLTGLMTRKQTPLGEIPATQTYDSSGRVTAQTDPNKNTTTLAYDGKGTTTITDPSGNVTKQSFDNHGDITQLTGASGASSKFSYDGAFHRTGVTDRSGNSVSYSYDAATGKPATRTDPAGNVTKLSYITQTQNGASFTLLSGITDAGGRQTSFSYDAQGKLISMTVPDQTNRTFTYDTQGRRTSSTAANGAVTRFTFNPDFSVAASTDALNNTTSFAYDALGRVARVTDPNGSSLAFTYDARGATLTSTNEYGAVTTFSYDADGRLAQRTNAYGGTGTYTWNADGTLAAYSDALGATRQFLWDANQRLSGFTNALGQTVRFTRNAAGRLLSIADGAGTRVSYTYNAEGARTSMQDPLGRKWIYGIDAFGRRSSTTAPSGAKTSVTFDKTGRLSSVTDALGQTSAMELDAMGRATKIVLPGGISSLIARNSLGLPVSVTDPNGNLWKRDYDVLGRLSSRTDPLGKTVSYAYTGTRLSGITTPMGAVAITTDAGGRMIRRQYWDGTNLNQSFDNAGQLVNADGVTLKRDQRGRIVASNGIIIGRDASGRIASLRYADGKTIQYTYDASGKLSQIADWAGAVITLQHNAAGEMTSLVRSNGVESDYSYDSDGRLASIVTGTLASIKIVRDPAGRIVSADRNLPLAPVLTDSSQTLSFDAASQLTTATYDAMGRVVALGNRSFTWDGASRMTSFSDGGTSFTMNYDALGEMTSFTNGGPARNFVFNYALAIPALSVVQQDGADLRYYVYLPNGKLLYSIEAVDNSRHFYHFDELGNTAFLTDDAGNVTDSYAITPYGEILDHPGTSDNPFTFQGQYGVIQEAPGLYYMRSRHYDAATARFLSRDTAIVTDPRGVAPYAYARANPAVFNDPLGNGWFGDAWNAFTGWVNDTFFPPETPPVQAPDPAPDYSSDAVPVPEAYPDPSADPAPDSAENSAANSDTGVTYTVNPADFALPLPPAAADSTGGHCCNGNLTITNNGTNLGSISLDDLQRLIGQDSASLRTIAQVLSHGGETLQSLDLSTLLGMDGAGLILQSVSSLISQDGAGLQNLAKLIAQDGAGIVASGAGNIVAAGGGNIVASGGGNIVASGGGNIVAAGGGNIVASGGGNIVASGGGNIVAAGGGNIVAAGGGN